MTRSLVNAYFPRCITLCICNGLMEISGFICIRALRFNYRSSYSYIFINQMCVFPAYLYGRPNLSARVLKD